MKKSKKFLTMFCLTLALSLSVLPARAVYADDPPQGGSNSGVRPAPPPPPPPPTLTWGQLLLLLLGLGSL